MTTVDELHDHAGTYEPHTTVRVSYAIASSITSLQLTKLQLDPLKKMRSNAYVAAISFVIDSGRAGTNSSVSPQGAVGPGRPHVRPLPLTPVEQADIFWRRIGL